MRTLALAPFVALLAYATQADAQPRATIVDAVPACDCRQVSVHRVRHARKRIIVRRAAYGLRTRIVKVVPSIGVDPLPYRFDAVPVRRYVVTRYAY